MKKYILSMLSLLLAIGASAQNKYKLSVTTKNGDSYTYETGISMDSLRVIDEIGIKVYPVGTTVSVDYLFSQIEYSIDTTIVNLNKNTAADLAKNSEGWRLEFPRFYQGSNRTYEITHSTADYGITYSLEWDADKKANRWTCYQLHAGNSMENVDRGDNFMQDPDIPSEDQPTLANYKGSGFSRGHLCPSADRLCSSDQNAQTFYLSNMQPQWQNHNGVLWANLEALVRNTFNADTYRDTLYIVKAATIDNDSQIYTPEEVTAIDSDSKFDYIVPKYFYMAILSVKNGKYKALGLWTVHTNTSDTNKNYGDYAISIDKLEELTGIDFFCNLPDEDEDAAESELDLEYWGLSTTAQ